MLGKGPSGLQAYGGSSLAPHFKRPIHGCLGHVGSAHGGGVQIALDTNVNGLLREAIRTRHRHANIDLGLNNRVGHDPPPTDSLRVAELSAIKQTPAPRHSL